ncbi:MAG: non-ribosomal peptide synthetase, partial [Bacteroidota bacterium]
AAKWPDDCPVLHRQSSQLAYVIYTSGSTGQPKGVMIEHRGLVNLCHWHKEVYSVNSSSRQTLFASTAFDASVWEIFPALFCGATLYPIAQEALRYDVQQLHQFLQSNQITHSFLPPQIVQEMIRQELPLENICLLTGGDILQLKQVTDLELYNNYGPTENTVVATFFDTRQDYEGSVPIGKPIHNVRAYVLSNHKQLQPIGVTGELCISGRGLARGYWNQDALTAEKFIEHPFEKGERLYLTGDLVRHLPDGRLEFVGRKDAQIKLRGYRIELEEIEQVLLQQAGIQKAIAIVGNLKGDKAIIAYVQSAEEVDKSQLRQQLRKKLPEYMLPSCFVAIDHLPLTTNGKVNYKALPAVQESDWIRQRYVEPTNEIERQLVEIWKEVLEVEQVGITDGFFELGGHSIKAIRVLTMVEQQFQVQVDIKKIFVHPTIEYLALEIANAQLLKQQNAVSPVKKIIL